MTMFEQLSKIRELVDELYSNTEPHSSAISMLFLETNQAIDEAQKECKHYINGTDLDPFNKAQVDDIIAKMKRERVY